MKTYIVTRQQVKEELDKVFKARITHLKDEIGRIERCPDRDSKIQESKIANISCRLAIAIVAQQQLQDLIKKHMKT